MKGIGARYGAAQANCRESLTIDDGGNMDSISIIVTNFFMDTQNLELLDSSLNNIKRLTPKLCDELEQAHLLGAKSKKFALGELSEGHTVYFVITPDLSESVFSSRYDSVYSPPLNVAYHRALRKVICDCL